MGLLHECCLGVFTFVSDDNDNDNEKNNNNPHWAHWDLISSLFKKPTGGNVGDHGSRFRSRSSLVVNFQTSKLCGRCIFFCRKNTMEM